MKRIVGAVVAGAMALGLAACSTGSTNANTSDNATTGGSEEGAFPVTVKHAFGETTIDDEPKRVVTLGWGDQDHVLSLGVVPVGATDLTWGGNENGSTDWFDAKVEELGGEKPTRYAYTDAVPVAEIAALEPDLVLATNSGVEKGDYDKLSEIADVVVYPDFAWGTPWRDSLEMVGKALGRPAAAAKVLEATESKIDAARADHPQLDGTTSAFAYLATGADIGIYDDTRVWLMEDFGLVTPDWVDDMVPEGEFYGTVSKEKGEKVEADVLLTYAKDDAEVKAFTSDRLLNRIPALASGNFVAETDLQLGLALTNPTPLSIPVVIEEFLPKVADAVEK